MPPQEQSVGPIGGFNGMMKVPLATGYEKPVLVSGADGCWN